MGVPRRGGLAAVGAVGVSIRESFVERFGADQAVAVFRAAEEHGNGINNGNLGTDPFKWAITICLGYECMSKEGYREHHGITASWDEIDQWIKDEADLASHDGDMDYLALFAGVYKDYIAEDVST
jgi:hypothetical protein